MNVLETLTTQKCPMVDFHKYQLNIAAKGSFDAKNLFSNINLFTVDLSLFYKFK